MLAALGLVLLPVGEDSSEQRVVPVPTATSVSGGGSTSTAIPSSGLAVPPSAAPTPSSRDVVPTTRQPGSGFVRQLPAPPLKNNSALTLGWNGSLAFAWDGAGAATFDPKRDEWRPLPPVEGLVAAERQSAWTGKELLVWSGTEARAISSDRWRSVKLPAPFVSVRAAGADVIGLQSNGAGACQSSQRVQVWKASSDLSGWQRIGTERDVAPFGSAVTTSRLYAGTCTGTVALDLRSGQWRSIADPPVPMGLAAYGERIVGTRWTTDSRLVLRAALYDSGSDRWTDIGEVAAGHGEPVWTGRELIFAVGHCSAGSDGPDVAYEPATSRWRVLPQLAWACGVQAVWTGTELIAVGIVRVEHAVAYRPE